MVPNNITDMELPPNVPPTLPSAQSQPQNLPPPCNPAQAQHRTTCNTPVSSPGLFSPAAARSNMSLPPQPLSEGTTPAPLGDSPYLHPLQGHKVRETHKALVDTDYATGRKNINQYEIIDELGRGVHGKVKRARHATSGELVAIKIIPRFSKKRRLGKITTMSTQDKSKREIAILKKIRHPNVVALIEVIDDPDLKKIYMVLEYVELGEIVWRKKGLPHICGYERRRIEREMRGERGTVDEEGYSRLLERRQAEKSQKRARLTQLQGVPHEHWSLEFGADEDDLDPQSRAILAQHENGSLGRSVSSSLISVYGSRTASRPPSRTQSVRSTSMLGTPIASDLDLVSLGSEDDQETPGPMRSNPSSSSALAGTMYGPYMEDFARRGRSPSMADSIISHMSSVDFSRVHDPFADDYSYVPCFTLDQARVTFRDTVLGLEYLHYEGVVHRDIKPANLLWTKEHRVKISDFGVSYFGRPIRYGEPDDAISESEARDFDNDLELAKTVGTPAFFAPELCYTDGIGEDQSNRIQPKISEQIDVWSLGVTLYCLIYARIPFLAEDEWQMFRKIATEEVYISPQRLRPVDPSTRPSEKSLYTRVNQAPYRDDNELAYEEVPKELRDLLARMLQKNPDQRIRLREVKRHPWVVQGIPNVVGWLDDTDPSRRTSGRKIQVDARDIGRAVIPLTFLERARSAIKKTVDKVIHGRADRAESASRRRRAASSAASSGGDGPATTPATPQFRDSRRKSLRGDDYFTGLRDLSNASYEHHPLTQSVAASPYGSPMDETTLPNRPVSAALPFRPQTDAAGHVSFQQGLDQRTTAHGLRISSRHVHAKSMTSAAAFSFGSHASEPQTMPTTPMYEGGADEATKASRGERDARSPSDDTSRARSVDRGLFGRENKHSSPSVAINKAVVPGSIQLPHWPRTKRGFEIDTVAQPVSPCLNSPRMISGYQHGHPQSAPNVTRQAEVPELDERPTTAHRIERPGGTTSSTSTAKPLQSLTDRLFEAGASTTVDPVGIPCPPSPPGEDFTSEHTLTSGQTPSATAISSASTSYGALATPLTSPSETTSPVSGTNQGPNKDQPDHMLAFQSDPSLPALLSSTSSVSADPEGDFLVKPGNVQNKSSLTDTADSLTPPAMNKEPLAGFPLEQPELNEDGTISVAAEMMDAEHRGLRSHSAEDDADNDNDSDSDEGLTMSKPKRRPTPPKSASPSKSILSPRRRDTNISIASTETAKKIAVYTEDPQSSS